jgi:hypothetical protein
MTSLLGSSCSELDTVPTQAPHEPGPRIEAPGDDPDRVIAEGSGGAASDLPDEFVGHYTWLDVSADVGWMSPQQAYGQAIVRYWASNVKASVELKVTDSKGNVVGTNTANSQDWWLIPWKATLYASTNVMVGATCGLIAQASAKGEVWDSSISSAQGLLSWGNKSGSDGKSASQASCTPPPTPTSGGDGSIPPSTGGTAQPPTYQPAPFVPSGHWECTYWFKGTDYEREYCTWYGDYTTKIPMKPMSLARLSASGVARYATNGSDLPSVFVIVSDKVPADAMAIVERHKQGPYKNVLLVPSPAIRPAVLVAALRALSDSRANQGETPAKDVELTLKGSILDQQIPAAARDYAANFAALVGKAKKIDAGTYGTRQILEIRLGDRK